MDRVQIWHEAASKLKELGADFDLVLVIRSCEDKVRVFHESSDPVAAFDISMRKRNVDARGDISEVLQYQASEAVYPASAPHHPTDASMRYRETSLERLDMVGATVSATLSTIGELQVPDKVPTE